MRKASRQVFAALLRSRPTPRSRLSERLNLTKSTITEVTKSLLERGLIREVGEGVSSGGRRPTLLDLNPNISSYLGVKIESSNIIAGLVNLQGNIVEGKTSTTKLKDHDPKTVFKAVERLLAPFYNNQKGEIDAVGIAIPGLISTPNKTLTSPPLNWENVGFGSLADQFQFNSPIYTISNVNALTLAETWFGAGRGCQEIICVSIEDKVNMGAVINSSLFRKAGDISHMSIDPDGPLCECGARGCLETLTSDDFLLREVPEISATKNPLQTLLSRANDGEQRARRIFHEMGKNLGIAIKNAVNLLNPETVIVGGKRIQAKKYFLPVMRETITKLSFPCRQSGLEVKEATLGEDAVLIGAAIHGVGNYLDLPIYHLRPQEGTRNDME